LLYGAKVGHYFNALPWLGLELDVYNTNPHIKQQATTLTIPGMGTVTADSSGATARMTTLAFNILARYPGERLQPYAGAGLGIFFARFKDGETGESQSSTKPGLNILGGLRYKVTDHIGIFGEYKFNYVHLSFDPTPSLLGFNSDFTSHNFVFGVGYHF
jgi:opacity protein-like surface antigen